MPVFRKPIFSLCLAAVSVASEDLRPLRGIAYGALPCKEHACSDTGWVSEDMMGEAYAKEWDADGRDDLGIMSRLGANAVRLYHSLGLEVDSNHGRFLDRAEALQLNVMPGYHTYGSCPYYNCFDTWKEATLYGFEHGFKKGDGWHPAVGALILLNEPDLVFPSSGPAGRIRAVLSALDGVLSAEREAGVAPGRVKLTVTWSFGMTEGFDGKFGFATKWGFQDMALGIADPRIANYTPHSSQEEMQDAFRTRWIHGLNTQAPWSFVKAVIASQEPTFEPIPWFIGEYGANGQLASTIQADLEDIQRTAEEDEMFLGAAFFQFQTAHFKGGSELNFGIFRLGDRLLTDISSSDPGVLQGSEKTWPVYCLSPDLSWLPGTMADRASAVAAAWHGSLDGAHGLCNLSGDVRRLDEVEVAGSQQPPLLI